MSYGDARESSKLCLLIDHGYTNVCLLKHGSKFELLLATRRRSGFGSFACAVRDLYELTHRRFAITRPMTCQFAALTKTGWTVSEIGAARGGSRGPALQALELVGAPKRPEGPGDHFGPEQHALAKHPFDSFDRVRAAARYALEVHQCALA